MNSPHVSGLSGALASGMGLAASTAHAVTSFPRSRSRFTDACISRAAVRCAASTPRLTISLCREIGLHCALFFNELDAAQVDYLQVAVGSTGGYKGCLPRMSFHE